MFKKYWILWILIAISLIANAVLGYLLFIKIDREIAWGPLLGETNETVILLERLSQLVDLPQEKPTIIKIENIEVLKQQNPEFYAKAQVGDIVFVFTDKALIFRPQSNKIINFAGVSRL